MARTVAIGHQNFETIQKNNFFYIDKTDFIREWWEGGDFVTLITRPRRFGKTLNMSMVEQFFSVKYAGSGRLFEHLNIWSRKCFRKLQGTYPVLSLSFANVKESNFKSAREKICQLLVNLYAQHSFLMQSDVLTEQDRYFFENITINMGDAKAAMALHQLSDYLMRYYEKRVIILLDEYDTPMQEAYVYGYWEEMAEFVRGIFHAALKTNPYLERAILTGITRIGRESIFSDLNNIEVVTTTSEKYERSFGFTQDEVQCALKEYGLSDQIQQVREWYDGFTFGRCRDVYNPWSILNYLDKKRYAPYWANSSENLMADRLIQKSSSELKVDFEELLRGGTVKKEIDEQIVYCQLFRQESAVWSLLLACGYLKVEECTWDETSGRKFYALSLTNREIHLMFSQMIRRWFSDTETGYNRFIKALLADDVEAMNQYLNKVALATFRSFDAGNKPSEFSEPERFYHGLVLGLLVELAGKYLVISNRESGFGRCDVMLEPMAEQLDAMIIEFKVFNPRQEDCLEDTLKRALKQIEDKSYDTSLIEKGISQARIRKYGFAFQGKTVLIGRS